MTDLYRALLCRDDRHQLCEVRDCQCECHPEEHRREAVYLRGVVTRRWEHSKRRTGKLRRLCDPIQRGG